MKKHIFSAVALALGLFFCGHCGLSAQAQNTAASLDVRTYVAARGDTFAMLGRRTGWDCELLAAMNNLSPGYSCRGGEQLILPQTETSVVSTLASRSGNLRSGSIKNTWQAPLSGVITSAFASKRSSSPHHGIDIATDSGTAILAAHKATVISAGWQNSVYGYAVLLDHGNGWQTHYAHCSKVLVKSGDTVRQGQAIALVGSTGNSTGPHLHLELIKDGVYLNPADYFTDLAV